MNSPSEVAGLYLQAGMAKTKLGIVKTLLLGIMAGFFISAAGIASSAAVVSVSDASVAKLISAAAFPAGLAMVLLAGSELFTGNCLLIIPLMEKKITVVDMLENWLLVYAANLAGSLIFSVLLACGGVFGLFDEGLAKLCVSTAVSKCSLSFTEAFIKGVLCNFFVCIAVWISFAAKTVSGKIMGIYFPIMLFVLCGFEHSVANMSYIPNGILAGMLYNIESPGLSWGAFLAGNLLPVTLGNIVGGVFVGLVYWRIYLCDRQKADNVLK